MSCALYSFRLNLDKGTPDEISKWCNEWFKFWVFQHEKGDGGYEHYQGEGSLRKKRRPTEILGAMQRQGGIIPNYIAPIPTDQSVGIKGLHHLRERYASKVDTRIAGPFYSETADTFIPKQYRNKELTQWQEFVRTTGLQECEQLSDRYVHWIYDRQGNHGKSNLAMLLELKNEGIDMPSLNDYKELTQALCNQLKDTNNRDPGIILIDLPRALPKSQMNGFTSACEQFKKGKVVDVRNHFQKWLFNTPSVWVFSNSLPPMSHLSIDRWKIWHFDGDGIDANLIPYVHTVNTEDLDL